MGASGGNALLVLATVAAVLFAAFYRNLLSAQPRPAKPAPRRRPESPPPRRSITLRVDLVPVDTAPEALEGQLRARRVPGPDLQAALATACVRSLVRSQPRFACATVALQSSLPEGQLLAALHQGNDGLPYRYDSTFQGITPLHADADAKCECVSPPIASLGPTATRLTDPRSRPEAWWPCLASRATHSAPGRFPAATMYGCATGCPGTFQSSECWYMATTRRSGRTNRGRLLKIWAAASWPASPPFEQAPT